MCLAQRQWAVPELVVCVAAAAPHHATIALHHTAMWSPPTPCLTVTVPILAKTPSTNQVPGKDLGTTYAWVMSEPLAQWGDAVVPTGWQPNQERKRPSSDPVIIASGSEH